MFSFEISNSPGLLIRNINVGKKKKKKLPSTLILILSAIQNNVIKL